MAVRPVFFCASALKQVTILFAAPRSCANITALPAKRPAIASRETTSKVLRASKKSGLLRDYQQVSFPVGRGGYFEPIGLRKIQNIKGFSVR